MVGTCSWIFRQQSYIDWISSDFPHGVPKAAWLNGDAGFGKTMLCAHVVQTLEQDHDRVIHHFFLSSNRYDED